MCRNNLLLNFPWCPVSIDPESFCLATQSHKYCPLTVLFFFKHLHLPLHAMQVLISTYTKRMGHLTCWLVCSQSGCSQPWLIRFLLLSHNSCPLFLLCQGHICIFLRIPLSLRLQHRSCSASLAIHFSNRGDVSRATPAGDRVLWGQRCSTWRGQRTARPPAKIQRKPQKDSPPHQRLWLWGTNCLCSMIVMPSLIIMSQYRWFW